MHIEIIFCHETVKKQINMYTTILRTRVNLKNSFLRKQCRKYVSRKRKQKVGEKKKEQIESAGNLTKLFLGFSMPLLLLLKPILSLIFRFVYFLNFHNQETLFTPDYIITPRYYYLTNLTFSIPFYDLVIFGSILQRTNTATYLKCRL